MLLQSSTIMVAPVLITVPKGLTTTLKTLYQIPTVLKTLYLFTANDFLTFALPTTLFATLSALSGSPLTTNRTPALLPTLPRLPLALLVVWTNLLVFTISNQRSPDAVAEDKINKPHRPIPSGRISCPGARRLLAVAVPVVVVVGWGAGVLEETLLLCVLTWMYNDLNGSEEHWVSKNGLIAVGYGLYSCLALRIMAGPAHTLTATGAKWVGVITVVILTTQHIADIKDAEGDRIRGRRSAAVALGDAGVRWSVAIPTVLCSLACPAFFGLGVASHMLTLAMGCLVAGRVLAFRDLKADKLTWKLWVLWTCGLFALPLVKNPEVLFVAWGEAWARLCLGGECAGALNLVAVSGVALVVKGRRVFARVEGGNGTVGVGIGVPEIRIDGVVG